MLYSDAPLLPQVHLGSDNAKAGKRLTQ